MAASRTGAASAASPALSETSFPSPGGPSGDRPERSLSGRDGVESSRRGRPPTDSERARELVRVLVVEDHPAVAIGLESVLRREHDIEPVGIASSPFELWPLLRETAPDVVLLDYHLDAGNGLELCRRIKAQALAPAVLVYTAFAEEALAGAVVEAGAAGLVSKGAPARELFQALRAAVS